MSIQSMAKQDSTDKQLVREYKDYCLKNLRSAYIDHETKLVKSDMRSKGFNMDILVVSAKQYSLCLDEFEEEAQSILTPDGTGLPRLRQYLFSLPSQTNYRMLHHHVFETLPDIVTQVQRIHEKFDEDEGYAQMRSDLSEELPNTREFLKNLAQSLPVNHPVKPMDLTNVNCSIIQCLTKFVRNLAHPIVRHRSLVKMLMENGIPVNGVARGRNLNDEILRTMLLPITKWYEEMRERTKDIAMHLHASVENVLKHLNAHVENLSCDPELKGRASDALDTTSRRIDIAYGDLAALLQKTLRKNYLLFTTEVNIKCPIALAMKPIYHSVLAVRGGKGAHRRHLQHLNQYLVQPFWPSEPFPDIMATKISDAQRASWQQCCEDYVSEAMTLLENFARIVDELLEVEEYTTSEFCQVREELFALLPGFERKLALVQKQFPGTETLHVSASKKRKHDDERLAIEPLLSVPSSAK
jgi:hypothetical protein